MKFKILILKITRYLLVVLRWLMMRWVKPTIEDNAFTKRSNQQGQHIYYVLPVRSLADALLLEQICMNQGFPNPVNPFVVAGEEIDRKSVVFLRWFTWFKSDRLNKKKTRPPQIKRLIATLKNNKSVAIELIPVSIFWGRSPEKERSLWKIILSDTWSFPSVFQKWLMILWHGRDVLVQLSEPLSLRQLIDEEIPDKRIEKKLLRILRVHFRRQREAVVGPDLSHRRTLVNDLLTAPRVRQVISELVRQDGQSEQKLSRKARKYANEIAADYSHIFVRVMHVVLTWLWNRLYEGVNVYGMHRLKQVATNFEVIYVPCHRSHIDYLLLSYVVYVNGLVPPHIAAGVNLNLPVLGKFLRRGGAFFLRRQFRDNKLYAAVFHEYLHIMLKKGHSIEYFVEGGRSRTGRLLDPRAGMLSMTIRSYLAEARRPLVFVPVYIGYEKIFEGSTYVGELYGRDKKPESWWDLYRAVRKLQRVFGQVYVNFANPIELDGLLQQHQVPIASEQPITKRDIATLTTQLAIQIMREINQAVVVNSINLLAVVLLSTPRHAMDEGTLSQQLMLSIELLNAVPFSENFINTKLSPDEIIAYGERMQVIQRVQHPLGDLLYITHVGAVLLTYFKNNINHLFVASSFLACIVRNKVAIKWQQMTSASQLLYPFLQSEFTLHQTDVAFEDALVQTAKFFIEQEILVESESGIQLASQPKTTALQISLLESALQHSLERYYIVLLVLLKKNGHPFDRASLEQDCHLVGQRISILYEFDAPEFFDLMLFRRFITTLIQKNWLPEQQQEKLMLDPRIIQLVYLVRQLLASKRTDLDMLVDPIIS